MNETTKRAKSFLIVGAHFRPPAKALVAGLPGGAEVWLKPEPSNPYDAHAVKVLVNMRVFPEAALEEIEVQASGYGHDLESLKAGEAGANDEMAYAEVDGPNLPLEGWWHIGYIPAQKPGKLGEPENPDEIVWNMDLIQAASPDGIPGTIAFDATGKPLVMVSPWPPGPRGPTSALGDVSDDDGEGNDNWGDE